MSLRYRPTAVGALSLALITLTAGVAGGAGATTPPPPPPAGVAGGAGAPPPTPPPAWQGFANNAQHTGVVTTSPQPLSSVHWQVTVDHKPSCCVDGPLAHYATPMITSGNTVVVPI